MFKNRWRAVTVAILSPVLMAPMLLPVSAIAEEVEQRAVALDLDVLATFADDSGDPVTVTSDESNEAERNVAGELADGTPVFIRIYFGDPAAAVVDEQAFLDVAQTLGGEQSGTGIDDPDLPLDTSGFVARLAVATTPTTLSVAWRAPSVSQEFGVVIDGTEVASGPASAFIVKDLAPDSVLTLSLDSRHEETPQEPWAPSPTQQCPDPSVTRDTDLAEWRLSAQDEHSIAVLAGSLVHIRVDSEATTPTTGLREYAVTLDTVNSVALDWEGTGAEPSSLLEVDFDGDGDADGSLTSSGSGLWQLVPGAAAFVVEQAPGEDGSATGPLLEWTSAFSQAETTAVGYDVPPGTESDGRLASIQVGCSWLTFDSPTSAPVAGTVTDETIALSARTLVAPSAARSANPRAQAGASTSASIEIETVDSSEFDYRTFLPMRYVSDSAAAGDREIVDACLALNGYAPGSATFGGDGRGFQPPSALEGVRNYRTRMTYRVDWESSNSDGTKDVGVTKVIDPSSDAVLAVDEATTTGMTFRNRYHGSNFATVQFEHIANDPFCPSLFQFGAISYTSNVSFYRTGVTIVSGTRFTMPAHEGWVRWNDERSWTNVFALKPTGLLCLVAGGFSQLWTSHDTCVEPVKGAVARSGDTWAQVSDELLVTGAGATWGHGGNGLGYPVEVGFFCSPEFGPFPMAHQLVRPAVPIRSGGVGRNHGVALADDGQVMTWGNGWSDALGRPQVGDDPLTLRVAVPVDGRYLAVDTSQNSVAAVTESGDVYGFGDRVGWWVAGDRVTDPEPTAQLIGHNIRRISVDDASAVAIDADGRVWYHGIWYDDNGASVTPWRMIDSGSTRFSSAEALGSSFYAIDTAGRLWAGGWASVPDEPDPGTWKTTPVAFPADVVFSTIHAGPAGVNLIAQDGTLYEVANGWGAESFADMTVPGPPSPVVAFDGRSAISSDGNWWEREWVFDDEIGDWKEHWANWGRPPSKAPPRPEVVCGYPS